MQRSIRNGSIAAAALAALSSSASAAVLWRGDFSTGDLAQWTSVQEQASDRLQVVAAPGRPAALALRAEVRQGDLVNNGCRAEVARGTPQEIEGNERYYAWSTMFPADYPSDGAWQVFTQWHQSGSGGSPPLEFDVKGETILFTSRGDYTLWQTPLVRGVWHDFVLHVKFSASTSIGLVELWYDGKKVLAETSWATLYAGETDYLKQGLYRSATIVPTGVVFHTGMTVGETLADVAPQLANPAGAVSPVEETTAGVPPISSRGCASSGGADLFALLALLLFADRRARIRGSRAPCR